MKFLPARLVAGLMLGSAALALAACGETKPAEPAAPVVEAPPVVDQAVAPLSDPMQGDGGVSAFYMPDAAIPATPGKMIRTEPQTADTSLPLAASAFRILYSSVNGLGDKKEPIAVSGSVFLPKGTAPAGGWPLIAWAHGTVGIADICAPSNKARSDRDGEVSQPLARPGLCGCRFGLSGPRHARRPSLSRHAPGRVLRPRTRSAPFRLIPLQHRQVRRPRRPVARRRCGLRNSGGGDDLRPRTRHSRHCSHRHALLHQRHRARRS